MSDDADRLIALESVQEAMSADWAADDKLNRVAEILAALDEDEDEADRPERIEFTIGVCVPMMWDADAGRYVLDGPQYLTDGGLFSDASDGVWVPDDDEWVRVMPWGSDDATLLNASDLAHATVHASIQPPGVVMNETPLEPGPPA
jgi:hypothetical protein